MTELKDLPQNAQAAIEAFGKMHRQFEAFMYGVGQLASASVDAGRKHHPPDPEMTLADFEKQCPECARVLKVAVTLRNIQDDMMKPIAGLALIATPAMQIAPDDPRPTS